MNHYRIIINNKEIIYGADVCMSHYSDEEWTAIHLEMIRQNDKELYELVKNNDILINRCGHAIDLEERYCYLLELLPQSSYSKAGTHPKWVADAVEYEIDEWIDTYIEDFKEIYGIKDV